MMFARRALVRVGCSTAGLSLTSMLNLPSMNTSMSDTDTFLLHDSSGASYRINVTLPQSYDARSLYPVLYVLDDKPSGLLSRQIISAVLQGKIRAAVSKRTWYPNLIVVSVEPLLSTSSLLEFVATTLIDTIDADYRTKPYASGRSLCGHSACGSAVRRAICEPGIASQVGYFLIGMLPPIGVRGDVKPPCDGARSDALPHTEPCVPARSVYMCASADSNELSSLRALKVALDSRTPSAGEVSSQAVVRVDPSTGAQRTEQMVSQERTQTATLDVLNSNEDQIANFATRAVDFLCDRMEQDKVAGLNRMYPWSEFR